MPAAAGRGERRGDPGHHLDLDPARRSASASSPPRPNTNGSPPFRRTTRRPDRPWRDQQVVDLGLAARLAGALAHVDALGRPPAPGRGARVADQPVVDDDVGRGQQLGAARRVSRPGSPGPAPDQGDAHDRGPPRAEVARRRRRRAGSGPRHGPGRARPRRSASWRSDDVAVATGHHAGQPQTPHPGRRDGRRRRRPDGVAPRPAGCSPRPARPGRPARPPPPGRTAGVVDGRQRRAGWPRRRPGTRRPAAPWATWGSMTDGSSVSTGSPSGGRQPRRSRAARATTTAVDPVLADPGQTGGQVAPQVGEGEVGPEVGQLDPAPGRPGGHRRPGREVVDRPAHQHVAGVAPLGERRQHQPRDGQAVGGGQVLGRVHGGVGVARGPRRPGPP